MPKQTVELCWACNWACFVHRIIGWFGLEGTLKVICFIIQSNTRKQDNFCSLSLCFVQLFIRSPAGARWERQVLLPFNVERLFPSVSYQFLVTSHCQDLNGCKGEHLVWLHRHLEDSKGRRFLWSIPSPITVSEFMDMSSTALRCCLPNCRWNSWCGTLEYFQWQL